MVKQWAIPAAAVIATATGAWVRVQDVIEEHARAIQELRESVTRSDRCGPDGFLDPAVHSAHDNHVWHWLRDELGRDGLRRWLNEYGRNGDGGSD
jgi:hypothetical protein